MIKENKESNKILKYKSIDDYTLYSVNTDNLSSLSGCFIRDNFIGHMSLSSFFISIKSLVSDFIYEKNIKLGQWADICGYMKKQIYEDMNNPEQLIHVITEVFERKALRDQQFKFAFKQVPLQKFRDFYFELYDDGKLTGNTTPFLTDTSKMDAVELSRHKKKLQVMKNEFLKMQNRSKLITVDPLFNKKEYLGKQTQPLPTERYLIEISYPKVNLAFKDQLISKSLVEKDIDVLIRAGFRGWMPFMMNTHFRMELNLT